MEERNYFIIKNGEQKGPFTLGELAINGLTADTPVWHSGMPEWKKASEVPEIASLLGFGDSGFGGYAEPEPAPKPSPSYAPSSAQYAPGYHQSPIPQHTNWLPYAIIATVLGVCSCIGLILGIIAIVNANKANEQYAAGNVTAGRASNSSAQTLTIVALVLDILGAGISTFFNIFSYIL